MAFFYAPRLSSYTSLSSIAAMDVMLQLGDGELLCRNYFFDQVSNRDQAHQLALIDHRQMPQALSRHQLHAFL